MSAAEKKPEFQEAKTPHTSPLQVREHLVKALHADLVGPYRLEESGPEVLRMPPSRWYLTGFLAPQAHRDAQNNDEEEQFSPSQDAEPAAGFDDRENVEDQAPRPRNFFPASIGVSVLVTDTHAPLTVRVKYANYKKIEDKDKKGSFAWHREDRPVATVKLQLDRKQQNETRVDPQDELYVRAEMRETGQHIGEAPCWALSVFLINRREVHEKSRRDEAYIFQVGMELEHQAGFEPRRGQISDTNQDFEENLADLQYRDRAEYAIGHGISIANDPGISTQPVTTVRTAWIPQFEVPMVITRSEDCVETRMEALAQLEDPALVEAQLSPLCDAYETWIKDQATTEVHSTNRAETRDVLVANANFAKKRIRAGIDALKENPELLQVFRWANDAIARSARARSPQRYHGPGQVPQWRLFQLAFLLINLPAIADPTHKDRHRVELIYFPTGGGKTEAYLGVIALYLFWRRKRGQARPDKGLGVSVLLRYTLRMLTQDQLGRAATLICAMESIRREAPEMLGQERFSVGMWVGGKTTPNKIADAQNRIDDYRAGRGASPCPITACPWCGTPLDQDCLSIEHHSLPGSKKKISEGVTIGCSNATCDFALCKTPRGIPVVFVDDQIYREPPAFLIATVDKFAMVPWRDKAGHLFGKVKARYKDRCYGYGDKETIPKSTKEIIALPDGYLPPDLIVQDELHLISGPLGTMVGLFESAVEQLSTRTIQTDAGAVVVRPKIVAATATVRNASAQVNAIFGRKTLSQFPPPGISDADNYFAHVDRERPGRLYLGVCASGRRMKGSLLRNYTALCAAAQHAFNQNQGADQRICDGYMTVVGYFNSIRELGGMRRLVEDQTYDLVSKAHLRKPSNETLAEPHLWSDKRQIQREPLELTSRESGENITDAKRRLELDFSNEERVDVVLASNMISVGVDINRLALMVVAGQPKTTSEYIQSSSRVGRDRRWPGLVVTCLNPYRPRDRSHYERFVAYHDSLYRFVEATSATPFSGPALDRGLAAALVAMTRHGHPELTPSKGVTKLSDFRDFAERAVEFLGDKAQTQPGLSPEDQLKLRREIENRAKSLLDSWERQTDGPPPKEEFSWVYSSLDPVKKGHPLIRTHEVWQRENDENHKTGRYSKAEILEHRQFVAPQSMRDTERNIHMWVRHALIEREQDDDAASTPRKKRFYQKRERLTLEGELRPSQLLSQFGPGAMVDLVDRSVLISSIDYWDYQRGEPIPELEDERLVQRISPKVSGDLPQRHQLKALREAPICDTQNPSRVVGIQALEFPQWFVCQNPKCRALHRKNSSWELKNGRYLHECERGVFSPFIPVRFVGACSRGHLQDFPWVRFAHAKAPAGHKCDSPRLVLEGGASGDFGELKVVCKSCGQGQYLATAMVENAALDCEGKRPWLGREHDEECDEKLRLIVRTASNAYFPQTISSLSIPIDEQRPPTPVSKAVQSEWSILHKVDPVASSIKTVRSVIESLDKALEDFSNEEVAEELRRQKSPQDGEDIPLRTREYLTFLDAPEQSHAGEVPGMDCDFFARKLPQEDERLSQVGQVVIASKLREIRVLTGFSRIDGVTQNLQGEFDDAMQIKRAPIRKHANWLPATELRGEGLLFMLNEERVRAWEERPEVKAREALLTRGHVEKYFDAKHPDRPRPEFPGVRYYMLHSLSHVLMSAISLECGYPASSIRERIYCGSANDPVPMAGILLTTGTAGSEGSLGGLVQEGRKLRRHLERALQNASLCTHDPICASHEPGGSHDDRHLEGAACHGCLYVAECSCERFNQYLDRALLVPTIGNDPRLAFFGKDWI